MNRLPHRLWLRSREVAVPRTPPRPITDDPRGWAWSVADHAGLDDEQAELLAKVTGRQAELARVAAEQDWPRLNVGQCCGGWKWTITAPDGRLIDGATAPTHRQALAVGLAALEQASMVRPASA